MAKGNKKRDDKRKPFGGKRHEDLIDELLSKSAHCKAGSLEEFVALDTLISKIRLLEQDLAVDTESKPRTEYFNQFTTWCTNNGVDCSKVEIFPLDDENQEFGLKATSNLKEDELLLSIPRKLMLTTESALEDVKFANFVEEDAIVKTMPNVLLALHLLNEHSKCDSFWAPYIKIFPRQYKTPLYCSQDDMKLLAKSQWFQETVKVYRSIARQYAYFWKQVHSNKSSSASQLPLKKVLTYEAYRWAVSTVMTRQNFVPSHDGKRPVNALIPLWDMCNHSNGKYSTDFDLKQEAALCYAMSPFGSGDEITIYYGNRSNGEFFIHNGFVYGDNEDDFVPLKLGISKNDALFAAKSSLCSQLGLPTNGVFNVHRKSKKPVDPKLLGFLRVFHMSQEQLEDNSKINLIMDPKYRFDDGLDLKVEQFLETRAKLVLLSYRYDDHHDHCNPMVAMLLQSEKAILESYT
ncbi:Actin-histidine N-methyltransferase [Halotydeus destructor]|nr:Actin-histidine N-methyltransferase [Halotydeus destructor]